MMIFQQYAAQIKVTLDQLPWREVQRVVDVLLDTWLANKQVFIMGNGGSAATASHMACDLGKNTAISGVPRMRVMSLNDNMALFSAYANDDGYEYIFAEQLISFMGKGDVVIAISASGNSPNILKGIELARSLGAITIGWSGYQGGRLAQLVQMSIVVPSDSIEQIEDIHLMLEHMVTVALREAMQDEVANRLEIEAELSRTPVDTNGSQAVISSAQPANVSGRSSKG